MNDDNTKQEVINKVEQQEIKERGVVNTNSDKQIQPVNNSLRFNDYSNMQAMIDYVKPLINSSQKRWKSPEDLVMALLRARDLGIPETTMYNKGYVINGIVAVEASVKRGLTEKHGIILEEIEDDKPLYQYNVKGTLITQDDFDKNKDLYLVFNSIAEAKEAKEKGLTEKHIIAVKQSNPYDFRTTIRATRWKRTPEGLKKIVKTVSFTWLQAVQGGLTEKDVWINWRRDMLLHKCETRVCDLIGSDISQGLLTLDELFDINNVKYHIEDAEIVID